MALFTKSKAVKRGEQPQAPEVMAGAEHDYFQAKYDATDFSLDGLKRRKKDAMRKKAHSLLQKTDWYVVRNTETGQVIPADITTGRADIRQAQADSETAIDAETTRDGVRAVKPNWPS